MFDKENMQGQQRQNAPLFAAFFNEYFNVLVTYYR